MSARSVKAIENIHHIGAQYLDGNFSLRIIDVALDKEMAVEYQIVAVPTLIRVQPLPARTIIGDLSDIEKVLYSLGVS